VPGMNVDLKVKVHPEPGRRDRREAQGRDREGASEGSVERNREPTNGNRIRGAADQGELAAISEALTAKETRRKSGGCAKKANSLTQGDLALCLKGRRSRRRSEKSAEVVVGRPRAPEGPNVRKGRRPRTSKEEGRIRCLD